MAYKPHGHEGLGPAIFWGGLATGACYLVGITIWTLATAWAEPWLFVLVVAAIAWFFGSVAVAIGMIVIALPLSALFRWLECEDAPTYALAGAISGFLVPSIPAVLLIEGAGLEDALFYALPALIAGGTAGYVWGLARERLAQEAEPQDPPPPARDRGERWLR